MKIKTITCHDVYNSGASLQAYALMRYLQQMGNEVQIIDYKPDYLSNHYKILSINNPKYKKNNIIKLIYLIFKLPERLLALRHKKKYDEFKQKYLNITSIRYKSNEELKNRLPEADIYICGSDQIWNCEFKNGKDPAFYLDFVPKGKIRASYAASFATESINNKYQNIVKERIKKLDYVSVREISALNVLKNLDIHNGIQVMDPVFLLNKEEWDSMTYKINEKYIFVYDFDNSDLIKDIAIDLANEKELKIYTAFKSDYSNRNMKNMGPIDFISYIKNAEFIISNSFHGTAFSIIFEKDFIVINRKEKINTRMRDVLNELNIRNRLIDRDYDLSSIIKRIDYTEVNKHLNDKINISKKYLDKIISSSRKWEVFNEKKDIICN